MVIRERQPDAEPLVYTVAEAQKLLCLSRGLMYEAIRSGLIPSVRVSRRILIPRVGLAKFLETAAGLPQQPMS